LSVCLSDPPSVSLDKFMQHVAGSKMKPHCLQDAEFENDHTRAPRRPIDLRSEKVRRTAVLHNFVRLLFASRSLSAAWCIYPRFPTSNMVWSHGPPGTFHPYEMTRSRNSGKYRQADDWICVFGATVACKRAPPRTKTSRTVQ
jgi:hypothetical protein